MVFIVIYLYLLFCFIEKRRSNDRGIYDNRWVLLPFTYVFFGFNYLSSIYYLVLITTVVPAEEYEELSKLCERLLTQQEQLQLEVQKQSEMLSVSVWPAPYILYSCYH